MSVSIGDKGIEWALAKERRSRCRLSRALVRLYRIRPLRRLCIRLAERLEGGRFFSTTVRAILREYHQVEVGRYSYGPCLDPGVLPKGTVVGPYCSFASGLTVLRRNHPLATLSQHPFFYNSALGLLARDAIPAIEDNPLTVGADVWIGDQVTILPKCTAIGRGAVIGAGSVVTKDVAPYSIVAGNPARVIAWRFTPGVRAFLDSTKWWDLPLSELVGLYDDLDRQIQSINQSTCGDNNNEPGGFGQYPAKAGD